MSRKNPLGNLPDMPRMPRLPRQHQYEDFGEDEEEPRYTHQRSYEEDDDSRPRYDNLEDNLVRNIMIDEENFKRAKIFSIFMMIGMPILVFFIFGLNIEYIFFAFLAAALFSGVIILRAWWDMRSSHNDMNKKDEILGRYRR